MRFLTPGWFALALLALPILVMYMLRLRRREVQVSSTMLWQALLRDRQANTPWQRLKKNLLLFLQLLLLAALALALARPGVQVPVVASGSVVVLLDASASMAATDVKPNRFEAARLAVMGLINNLDRTSKMTLIQVARQPVVLAAGESDPENLRKTLAAAQLAQEEANWQTAFALAASAISAAAAGSTTVVIVSDGGIPDQDLPPLPAEIRYLPIGASGNNLAISALALRAAGERNELFVSVTNYSQQERTAILSIYLDDNLVHAQQLEIAGGERTGLSLSDFPTVDTTASQGIVMARLSPPGGTPDTPDWDALSLDNTTFAINRTVSDRRVLLVSPGNFFLGQILGSFPDLQAFRALPDETTSGADGMRFRLPEEQFDLYVLDEVVPASAGMGIPQLPDGNLLLINPPSNPLFSVTGVISPTLEMRVSEHPLTRFLDWSGVHIRQARRIQVPVWAETLVDSPLGPLVLAGETEGRRVAILTFDLNDSDLPLQVAFPILFANLIEYLLPPAGVDPGLRISPGDGVDIRVPSAITQVVIASPDGKLFTLLPTESGFFFPYTDELGIYAVNYLNAENQRAEFFAVNLFSPAESSIQPAASIQVGRTTVRAQEPEALGLREIWAWVAMAGLVILLVEWWVYHRRLTAPETTWLANLPILRRLRRS